jgi:phospholipase/carboxylesterase
MWSLLLLLACRSTPVSPTPSSLGDPSVWDDARTLVLGDGDDCTVVAIHGYGATPEGLERLYTGMPLDATVVLPRGPDPQGDGHRWFMTSRGTEPAVYGRAVVAAADRLAGGLQSGVPGDRSGKPPVLTGFSQGGMLSWTVAATHPELVRAALPIGGLLPEAASVATTGVPITAFHGTADRVVPFAADEASATRLGAAGWTVDLRAYPGVGHTIPPSMHRDYRDALVAACR